MTEVLRDFGRGLAAAVAAAAPSVLHIERGRGLGATGFAWSDDLAVGSNAALVGDTGHVLTGTERRAVAVIGRDPGTDVALLRIEGGGLTPLALLELDEVEVGHVALALGRPGPSTRASLRIIGALAGEVRTPAGGRLERYLETDRGLPAGFSGGPLIDAEGRGLGMNTRALWRRADLAVPVVTLRRVVAELEQHGAVRTGYLGVGVQAVRLPAAVAAQVSRRSGALVVSVAAGGPAEAAGLVLGDVILAIDGDPVSDPIDLRAVLLERAAEAAAVTILRAGTIIEVDAAIGERRAA